MENLTGNEFQQPFISNHGNQTVPEEGGIRPCFNPELSQTLQRDYFHYTNFVLTPLTILLGLWCILSNGSVLLAVYRAGFRCRPGFLMMCSLTLSDFLWGGLVTPMYVTFRVRELVRGKACSNRGDWDHPVMVASFFLCLFGTLGNLAIMSCDRYLAIAKAMWYKVTMSRRHAFCACASVWLASIFIVTFKQVNVIPLMQVELIEACFVGLNAAAIIIIQVLTLRFLHKHNSIVAQITANPSNAANAANERKLTVSTSYVVGLLGLVLIPCAIVVGVSLIIQFPVQMFIEPLYFPIATLCSGINPVLYYRGNGQLKEWITNLIKCQ